MFSYIYIYILYIHNFVEHILTENPSTTILEHQNNKLKYNFLKHYILETCNPNLTELIFKPVLIYLNVFSY